MEKDKEKQRDRKMTRGAAVLYVLLTLAGGIGIVSCMVNTIWVHGDTWRKEGLKREAGTKKEPARRGIIYSSDGKILATTVTECDFYLDLLDTIVMDKGKPRLNSKGQPVESGIADSNFTRYLDTVCQMISEAVGSRSASYYRDRIATERAKAKPRRCFLVERRVPYSTWLSIGRLPGWRVGVVREVDGRSVIRQVRAHIYGNLAGNTVGFDNGRDNDTYTGLEGAYDSLLRGQDGIYTTRRLTKGIWLPDEPRQRAEVPQRTDNDHVDTIVVQNKIDGDNIVATIDTRFQDIAENSLRKALQQYGGQSGCVILMEMNTGYVLACANLAGDSLGRYREMRDENVAVSHVYEPGSTFKTVILTAMLNDPDVKIDTAMKVQSHYKNFGGKQGEIKDSHKKRDSLSVKEVIEESSNVGMCELGWMYYNTRRDTLRHIVERMFPYGKISPDVKAPENTTYINDLHRSNRDFLNFCYGYSTRISALQLVTFYNALGAGGRMVKPQFCKGVMRGGKLVKNKPIVLNAQICSRESALLMRELLESVVEHGTGDNIKNNTYGIAGKTGTAVHSYRNRQSYNASFCGFFPSESPRYTCLVVLEDIPFYGRQAALVFKDVSDCVVAMDSKLGDGSLKSAWPQLERGNGKEFQQPALAKGRQREIERAYELVGRPYRSANPTAKWVYYQSARDSIPGGYRGYVPPAERVPNCYGMSARDAVELLHSLGYRARVSGYGKVASQNPKAGSTVKKGSVIELEMKNL